MFALAVLPFIPFKSITEFMTPFEIVKLAMSKEALFNRLAQLRFCAKTTTYSVDLGKKIIEVKFEDENNNFTLHFNGSKNTTSTLSVSTTSVGILNVLRRLQRLFPGPVTHLKVDLKVVEEALLERLQDVICEKLTVSGNPRRIPKKRVAEILNKVQATQEIIMEAELGTRVFPSPPTDKLSMSFATGYTESDLLALSGKTRVIELLESQLTPKNINAFIEKWLSGSDTTTSFVTISREDEEDWCLAQVLKTIPSKKFDQDVRDRQFITSRTGSGLPQTVQNMSDGLDILRKDGLMATVSSVGSILYFCVWSNRNEIKTLVNEYTQKTLDAQNRTAQLEESTEAMKLQIAENVHRIEATMKQVEQMEQKDETNIALNYFLESLRADITGMVSANQKIQMELQTTSVRINEAKEESMKMIKTLGSILVFM